MFVVVADKDPYDLEALRGALVSPEREVVTFTDGNNVLTIAQARSPDAVVIASSLGHEGGLGVSRQLKTFAELGQIRDPKVIVLFEREADAWLAEWARCDAWRVKPIDSIEIAHLVDELVKAGAKS